MFDANQDHLVSPHMLHVGEELTTPEAELSTPSPAPVTSVQIVGAAECPQEALSYEVRRRLLESRFFEPIGIPRVPIATVRLLSSLVPRVFRPGLRLMVDRKMP